MADRARLRVKLVGCGGIGGHLAPNLCRFLHADGRAAHVVLIDGDAYEERNRARMRVVPLANKAVALAAELAGEFGGVLAIEPVPEYATPATVASLVGEGDLVLLAVDNHGTRRLIDEHCATLRDVTLVSGGNDGIEDGRDGTYGNVQVVRRVGGRALTSSLGRLHPEIRAADAPMPGAQGCVALAASAPQLLVTNLAVASAMLSAVWALLEGPVDYEEVYVDVRRNRVVPRQRTLG